MIRFGKSICVRYRGLATIAHETINQSNQPPPFNPGNCENTSTSSYFKCVENNPAKHRLEHESKFYTISPETQQTLFTDHCGTLKDFKKNAKTFREFCFMIRKPAVEIISYLQAANYSAPVNRYLLYGRNGVGKSITLSHLVHFASVDGWVIVHVPWAPMMTRTFKEVAPSQSRPGRMDLPADAAAWLQHFKSQNLPLLEKLQLTTSQEYTWSKREITEKGKPLLEVVDHGLNRVKFAADCLAVLLKELKFHANNKRAKVFVAIDGVNALFSETRMKREDKTPVEAHEITNIRALKKVIQNDWINGAVLGVVCTNANPGNQRESFYPRYVLGKEGFEWLDPFVPVLVQNYTKREANSCLDYYIDRLWIQTVQGRTEDGKKELMFLSGCNPGELERICAPW